MNSDAPRNLALHLDFSARADPDRVALIGPEGPMTYRELRDRAGRIASGIHRLGVRESDRVAFAIGNTPQFAEVHYATLLNGAVSVPLNPGLKASELRPYLRSVAPRLIVAEESAANEVMSAGPHSAPVFVIGSHPTARPFDELIAREVAPVTEVSADSLAVLAYTSGTAGSPKAAMLTHGNIWSNIEQMRQLPLGRTERDDLVLGVLPLFHIFGMSVVLGLTIREGGGVLLQRRFDPVATLESIETHRVTIIVGAPPMFEAWLALPAPLRSRLESVRFAASGASALSPRTIERFREAFGVEIWEGYGLTETSPTVATTRMASQRPGSIGKVLPGQQVRIVDSGGIEVIPGDVGEIWVRGPNVFVGYWNDDQATSSVLEDGWFRTGDLAYQDLDGFIWLVDRKKELIIVSGFNVYPKEVEEALLTHPAVAQAAVIGEAHGRQGEGVKAFVVPRQGEMVTDQDLIVHCTRLLARYKVPSDVEIVEELPRLPTGKVLKRLLRPAELGPNA